MSTLSEKAIAFVMANEGGYADDPRDPGGCTNFGLSLRFMHTLDIHYNANDIRLLTPEKAAEIYKQVFWKPVLEQIHSEEIPIYIFDMIVNVGEANAVMILQRALWAAAKRYQYCMIDGILGSKTI